MPWNCLPFNCCFTCRNKQKSYGAKYWEYWGGGVVDDQVNMILFHIVQSGSSGVGTRIVVVEWQAAATGVSVWVACVPTSKTLIRQVFMYRLALTVFLSGSWTKATWRRPQSSIWKCFLISWISQVGSQLGKERLKTAAWFPGSRSYKSLSTRGDVQELLWPAYIIFLKHVKEPLSSTPPLFFSQLVGHPMGTMLVYIQVMMEDPIQASQWKIQTVF